jgi:hypothetical protein
MKKRGIVMNVRSGISTASCFLMLSLPAGEAVAAKPRTDQSVQVDSLSRIAIAPVNDPADWFPISLVPVAGPTPLKPTAGAPSSENPNDRLSQPEIQVPATVQNLRRADL